MQSRTSCCNGTLFRKDLARFWPIWAAYVVIWFLLLPLGIISSLRIPHGPFQDLEILRSVIHTMMGTGTTLMSFFFAILVAMAVFSYLYQNRSVNFFHALPMRRERQFLVHSGAGLFMLVSADVVIFLLSVVAEAACGCMDVTSLLQWLALIILSNVAFFGFAAFCAMLTGHILALPCIYVILQFAFVAAESLVRYVMQFFIFGMGTGQSRLAFLSPCFNLVSKTRWLRYYDPDTGDLISEFFQGWGVTGLYCLAGIVFLVFALMLYRHRRMESSSDVIAIRVLKPVFRWCLAVAGALCVASFLCLTLFEDNPGLSGNSSGLLGILFLLIGGFIGWFVADILLKKSFRIFRDHWKGFLLFAVIVIVLSLICQYGALGYEKRIPSPETVASVEIVADGDYGTLESTENIAAAMALHESILGNKAIHEGNRTNDYCRIIITYFDDNDKVILQRHYLISAEDTQCAERSSDLRMAERLLNTREAILSRVDTIRDFGPDNIWNAYLESRSGYNPEIMLDSVPAGGFTQEADAMDNTMTFLTAEEAYEFYTECILPDVRDGTMKLVWLVADEDYAKAVLDVTFSMEVINETDDPNREDRYDYNFLNFEIPVGAERTVRWLEEHGYNTSTLWDVLSEHDDPTEIFRVY